MLRIHLSAEDLRKIRLDPPDVLSDLVANAWAFSARTAMPLAERSRLMSRMAPAWQPLLDVTAHPKWCPDFLTPGLGSEDFDAGLAAVLATPDDRICRELAPLAGRHAWVRDPATVRGRIGPALTAYYHDAYAARQDARIASVASDRAVRAHQLVTGGVDLLLATLHPLVGWEPPVLALVGSGEYDVHLRGRGLRLVPVPSLARPGVIAACDGPVQLHYPTGPLCGDPGAGRDPLPMLLGRTRAAVLRTVGSGATTSQIAHRLDISVASASEHATVLRKAGLVTSGRLRNTVVHTLSPLGLRLVTIGRDGDVVPP